MGKTNYTGGQRDDTAKIIGKIHGVSADYVRKVMKGERENEDIMASVIDFRMGKTKLIKSIEQLVPIHSNSEKACK